MQTRSMVSAPERGAIDESAGVIAPERVAISVSAGASTAAFMPPEAVEQRLCDIDTVREIARQAKAWYKGRKSPWLGCHEAVRG